MFSSSDPQEIAQRLRELLDKTPAKDIERNLRAFGLAMVENSPLVSREEFNAQSEMLAKAFAKLEGIETQLRQLNEALESREEKPKKKRRETKGSAKAPRQAGSDPGEA